MRAHCLNRAHALVIGLVVCCAGLGLSAPPVAFAVKPAADQLTPALAYNPDLDEYLVVWSEDRGGGADLFAKDLFSNGLPKGGPEKTGGLLVRETDPRSVGQVHGPRVNPALTYNADLQEYYLVFSEQLNAADGFDVFGLRVASNGFARGAPRLLVGGAGDQGHPAVAYNSNRQTYLLVYDDNTRDTDQVWGARIRGNGLPNGQPFGMVQGLSNAEDPTVAVRGDGFLVAWVDTRNGNRDIYARRVNENGLPVGGATGLDYALRQDMENEESPSLDPASGQLVYNVFDPATGLDVLGVQLYDNGRTKGSRAIGIVVPAADQADPSLAINSARGESVVAFADNRSGQFDLYAVRLRNNLPRGTDYPLVLDGFVP